jgi:hypothetical protein
MKYLFLALSVVLIFAACNKTPTPTLTRLDMFRTGRWKLSSGNLVVKEPNGKDTNLNYLNFLPSCYAGGYIVFNSTTTGAAYTGTDKCLPSDPDSTQFQWALSNNYNNISFYRGFTLVWSVTETINPIVFDTLSHSPLELDTLFGVNDTLPGFTRTVVILDSIWNLTYTRDSVPTFDIDNAVITSFSQSAFTIYFTMISTYPDSLNHHEGYGFFTDPTSGGIDTTDLPVIITPDTFQYTLTYTNF